MVVWPEMSSPAQSLASVMKVPSNSCFPCRAAFCSFCLGSLGESSGSLRQQTNAHARHNNTTRKPARNVKIEDRRKHHHFLTLRHSGSDGAVVVPSSDEAIPGREASRQARRARATRALARCPRATERGPLCAIDPRLRPRAPLPPAHAGPAAPYRRCHRRLALSLTSPLGHQGHLASAPHCTNADGHFNRTRSWETHYRCGWHYRFDGPEQTTARCCHKNNVYLLWRSEYFVGNAEVLERSMISVSRDWRPLRASLCATKLVDVYGNAKWDMALLYVTWTKFGLVYYLYWLLSECYNAIQNIKLL